MIDGYTYLNDNKDITFQKAVSAPGRKDTHHLYYNCGGYALGTYTWVMPISDWDLNPFNLVCDYYDEKEMREVTDYCLNVLLNEIEELRVLQSQDDDLLENEVLIAFRISNDGDFHFMRQEKNENFWRHKRGNKPCEKFYGDIYKPWFDRYDGPLIFFALYEENNSL